MNRDGTLSLWLTVHERGYDKRTGAVAEIRETIGGRWYWRVRHTEGAHEGGSSSRKGARAAARRFVRNLPTVAATKKQLSLF